MSHSAVKGDSDLGTECLSRQWWFHQRRACCRSRVGWSGLRSV